MELRHQWRDYKEAIKRSHWRQSHTEANLKLYSISPYELMTRLRKTEAELKVHEMKCYMYHEIEINEGKPTKGYFTIFSDIKHFLNKMHS